MNIGNDTLFVNPFKSTSLSHSADPHQDKYKKNKDKYSVQNAQTNLNPLLKTEDPNCKRANDSGITKRQKNYQINVTIDEAQLDRYNKNDASSKNKEEVKLMVDEELGTKIKEYINCANEKNNGESREPNENVKEIECLNDSSLKLEKTKSNSKDKTKLNTSIAVPLSIIKEESISQEVDINKTEIRFLEIQPEKKDTKSDLANTKESELSVQNNSKDHIKISEKQHENVTTDQKDTEIKIKIDETKIEINVNKDSNNEELNVMDSRKNNISFAQDNKENNENTISAVKKIDFSALDDMDGMILDDLVEEGVSNDDSSDDQSSENLLGTELTGSKQKSSATINIMKSIDLSNAYSKEFDMSGIKEIEFKKTKSQVTKIKPISINATSILSSITDKKLSEIIMQLMKHNETLSSQLEVVKHELDEKSADIEKMRKFKNINPLNMTENKIHFAFLYASPLVREMKGKVQSIMQLNWLSEIEDILNVLKNLDYELKYRSCVATRENFRSAVTDCPIVLHFSGHGIENNIKSIGTDSALYEGKGNILLLEDCSGKSHYFFEEDLKALVDISKNKFEVVFVSSCHSEFAGKVFLNAGAKHVICIRGEEQISDKASLLFSKVFYETLFCKKFNVCDSFMTAKDEVKNEINNAEANKFLLFTQESHGTYVGKKHKCSQILNLKKGELINIDREPLFNFVPTNVEGFIDRQQEMHSIISLLNQNKIVTIIGPAGIGKTSIARNLANYLKERK